MHNLPMMTVISEESDDVDPNKLSIHSNTNGTLNLTFNSSPDLNIAVRTVKRELPHLPGSGTGELPHLPGSGTSPNVDNNFLCVNKYPEY